ncbi:MAG: endonuclease/exonuclease/phosphatase family protein [Ktedonobacteraceae bacterium]|nr:endonuclease/exonuclease/phosphatase family protein [Ktedonobacteraceae bacterium]
MTTIVSYNILAGGYNVRNNGTRRTAQLASIIRSAHPDIVGLVEATHPLMEQKPLVIEELATTLGMQLIMGASSGPRGYQLALLTRLPVIRTQAHSHPGIHRPLLEVCVEETNGQQLTVFVTHLSANFNKGRGGGSIRQREVQEILRILAPARAQGISHVLIGDFNSLAPGDSFQASALVRYVIDIDSEKHYPDNIDGHPHLNGVVPPKLRFLNPILHLIPRSRLLSMLFDTAASLYVPRACIRLLYEAGYVDCYRRIHPQAHGFTCPAASPAGRIDFIFASPEMAHRLGTCYVLTNGEGIAGSSASDHLAVGAEFCLGVQPVSATTTFEEDMIPS